MERYGMAIYDDPDRNIKYKEFMEWASQYDVDPNKSGFTRRPLKST